MVLFLGLIFFLVKNMDQNSKIFKEITFDLKSWFHSGPKEAFLKPNPVNDSSFLKNKMNLYVEKL